MSKLAKREENGNLGEILTQSILLSRFWVLKRSADVDGADFLVQRQSDSLEELRRRAREIQILGIVQSKYFEKSNQVKVQRMYVVDDNKPRKEFFCSLHTRDKEDAPVHYFFSAEDIVKEFELSGCGGYYWFAITKERHYDDYKNPKTKLVWDKIESGLNQAEGEANRNFMQEKLRVFSIPTMHYEDKPEFSYKLMLVEGIHVVVVQNPKTGNNRPLEQRRDLYQNQGDFYWGDEDTGCMFLAVSILAHHFNGNLPQDAPVEELCALLQSRDAKSEHVIESRTLRDLIENPSPLPNRLQRLEEQYKMHPERGDIAFFEVIHLFDTLLTVRCSKGVESAVNIAGCSDQLAHRISAIPTLMPGIERNSEPIKQMVAIRLSVERDPHTKKVLKIFDCLDIHRVH